MGMFCNQCQEAFKNYACTTAGVCGKTDVVASLQDLLIYVMEGISFYSTKLKEKGIRMPEIDKFILEGLFSTITNVNFDKEYFVEKIKEGLELKERVRNIFLENGSEICKEPDAATWFGKSVEEFETKAKQLSLLSEKDEDIRALKSLVLYGIKGMAAYADHAFILGHKDEDIYSFMQFGLSKLIENGITADELLSLVLKTGEYGVKTMALLDKANTSTYGNPEITSVNLGVRNNPGILISGHDLKDLEQLLEQTQGTGVDVYTHGEMLPAHYYPAFKKYPNFVGNYGNSWWKQHEEFEKFNGPILMTTNCLVPPKKSYIDRVYATGVVGYPGIKYIRVREDGSKDFTEIIEHAKKCQPPTKLEDGEIVGGFAHNTVFSLADKVVAAVKAGKIRKFFVMAGCDGRFSNREYYTEFASKLPNDTVILTAGCAKYRYNKLPLGDIDGIPRVLDAGQCNDSYSLAVIALKLKEIFNLDDINELPIAYNIAWYEQKAVIVLLSLLYLGVKNIHLGPTLPAFLSPNVAKILTEKFGIAGIGKVEEDIQMFMSR